MKYSTVVIFLVLLSLSLVLARRSKLDKKMGKVPKHTGGCKYGRPRYGQKGNCINGTRSITLPLKFSKPGVTCDPVKVIEIQCRLKPNKPNRKEKVCQYRKEPPTECLDKKRIVKKILESGDPEFCQQELIKEIPCKFGKKLKLNCKYSINFTECNPDTNTRTLVKTLQSGDDGCEKEYRKEKSCRKVGKFPGKCIYQKTFGECNDATKKVTVTKTLKKGDPDTCEQEKVIEVNCRRMVKQGVCKYRQGSWSDCDSITNKKTKVLFLKRGDPSTCPPTKSIERLCKRKKKRLAAPARKNTGRVCKYKKIPFEPCDEETNTKSRNLFLRKGDLETCNATKLETRPCKKKDREDRGGCGYKKGPWGPCMAATNTVTRALTLRRGDPKTCNETIDTRRCRGKHLKPRECKYRRTVWEDCDPITNKKSMVMTLKSGYQSYCPATNTIEKECKKKKKAIGRVCKYEFGAWGECDKKTNTMSRSVSLRSGNPATCPVTNQHTRKCKIACKFREGPWSECDLTTQQMQRIDKITKGSEDFCEQTRVITKKCRLGKKNKKCQYDSGTWSECNAITNKRNRVKRLVMGNPDQCEEEKVETKSCTRPNGKVRCFFGEWGDYGPCMNGVQKKQREVLQGGVDCQKKGVKMKPCTP